MNIEIFTKMSVINLKKKKEKMPTFRHSNSDSVGFLY